MLSLGEAEHPGQYWVVAPLDAWRVSVDKENVMLVVEL